MEQDIADAEEFIAMGDNDYVADNISHAQKRVEKANQAKPKSGEKAKRLAELQAINEEKAQAQAELDRWKKVQEEMERRANTQTQVVEQEASDNLTDNVKTDSGKGQVGESTEKVVGENQSSLSNNKKEGSVIGHTPKDVTTSSAERQGLDYEQSNKAETATKGSGITPQSTSSLGEDSKNSEESKEGDIKEPTYTEETLENGDNDASSNAVNQDKRFSVKGQKKKDIRRAREIVDKMLPPITGEGLGSLEGETYMEYVAKLFGGKRGIRITPESFHKEIGGGLAEKRKVFGILAGKDKGGMSIEG
ncbi:MAG: hypothetical protein IIW13_03665 [Paludibacteraceae bacterium]|nr:hypothetical protein [Paludibacteraceae bacterium]